VSEFASDAIFQVPRILLIEASALLLNMNICVQVIVPNTLLTARRWRGYQHIYS